MLLVLLTFLVVLIRVALQEFEAKYNEKKSAYDNVVATFEARTAALESEVSGLKVRRV